MLLVIEKQKKIKQIVTKINQRFKTNKQKTESVIKFYFSLFIKLVKIYVKM